MGLGQLLLHMCTSALVQHYVKQGKASSSATETGCVLALAAVGWESSPRMGLLAGQGQGSNELSPSSSALSGELSRVLWQTSNQDLWVSRYLLLFCPEFLLIWLRKCNDLVLLTSAFG